MIIRPKLQKGERHYLREIRRAMEAERRRGQHRQLGDIAGPLDVLDSARGQIEELRSALTLATAASTAAAIGVVLLLFRTGGRPARRRR